MPDMSSKCDIKCDKKQCLKGEVDEREDIRSDQEISATLKEIKRYMKKIITHRGTQTLVHCDATSSKTELINMIREIEMSGELQQTMSSTSNVQD